MPRSDSFTEPGASPLAPVEQLLHRLEATSLRVALGLAIGLIAARIMRRASLHWSWAVAGLPVGLLVHALARASASTLGLASLSAAAWGRRWHREDLDAGRDLCELAAARRSPLDLLRSACNTAALHRRMRAGASWFIGDQLIVGRDEGNELVTIPLGSSSGGTHTLVLGATGSGKTVTQSWIATRAIECGMGAIVIDPKGDTALREAVCDAAWSGSRAFIAGQRHGDRRQGACGRALHRAPLPASGTALSRPRRARAAHGAAGGEPAKPRRSARPRRARAAAAHAARGTGALHPRIP